MSHSRFNRVFLTLVLASGLCAFLVPTDWTNVVRGRLDFLFYPVASPARSAAQSVTGFFSSENESAAGATSPDAQREIERLRASLASITIQLAELRQLHANRELAGDVEKYSEPFSVIGGEQGSRESLLLRGASGDGLAVGMPVVHRDGVVGRITSVGQGGAQVRLITDRAFRAGASFGRFQRTRNAVEFVAVNTPQPLVEGRGDGTLAVLNLTVKQAEEAKVSAGDWVVLRDADDWPLLVNGYVLGQVEQVAEQAKMKLFAEIVIRPRVNLRQLREVMVVTGKPSPDQAPQVVAPRPTSAPAKPPVVKAPSGKAPTHTAARSRRN